MTNLWVMMERVDPDFAAYVVARWPTLVRSTVLVGATRAEAGQIVEEALSRCCVDWGQIAQTDRDVEVYRAVLETASRELGDEPREPEVGIVDDPTVPDPEQAIARRRALEEALARLPGEQRTAVVLRHGAELDETQLAGLLGDPAEDPDEGPWTPGAFREAGLAIPVGQPPITRVVARARARRRRTLTWTLGGVAVLAILLGVGTWFGTRPPEPAVPEAAVRQQVNPADIAWYANGVLHLAGVTVRLDGLTDVVEIPDGVVYADRDGRVVLVAADGELTRLGQTDPGKRLAASAERGWVAWVDQDTEELVVHSVVNDLELGRHPVLDGAQPVAIDQDKVFWAGAYGDWAWRVQEGDPEQLEGGTLLDVSSAVRAHRFADGIRIVQPLFDVEIRVPGEHAELSPDGDHVVTWSGDDDPQDFRVFSTTSGEEELVGLAPDDLPQVASFGPDSTISYIVAHGPNEEEREEFMRLSASGPRLLRTCELSTFGGGPLPPCRTITQFSLNVGNPLLPH